MGLVLEGDAYEMRHRKPPDDRGRPHGGVGKPSEGSQSVSRLGIHPPEEAGPAEAERILASVAAACASEALRKSKRMCALLRYLVQEAIERPGAPVTAEAIAANVFNRKNGFDAIDDPIVRTTVSRLRTALAAYYEQEAEGDEVEIRIPRGGYLPEFLPRAVKPPVRRRWERLRANPWVMNVASAIVALVALWVALVVGAGTCRL